MASFRTDPPSTPGSGRESTSGSAGVLTHGNARVKEARKLARRAFRTETGRFLADGPKAVEGALAFEGYDAEGCVIEVFATPEATENFAELVSAADAAGVPWTLVDDRALASLSDAVNPAGVVAVCRQLHVESALTSPAQTVESAQVRGHKGAESALASPIVAICADIRDPGNAGTVIRTADAAGASLVVLAGNSVDPYNPKTVRATVGSLFHLPIVIEPDPAEALRRAQAAGYTVLAADGAGELDLDNAINEGLLAGPTAWLFGNEAWGLPHDLAALADYRVSIPIHGRAESLNLSTAAAVCLYASARELRR